METGYKKGLYTAAEIETGEQAGEGRYRQIGDRIMSLPAFND